MPSHIEHSTSALSVRKLKVFKVLEQFNVYELNRFSKFIRSPYFNRNESLVRLFEAFEEVIRNSEENANVTRGEAWSSATLEKDYNDQKFRKLCSDLLRSIEDFLVQEELEKSPLHKADYLLQAILDKRLDELTNSSIRTAQRLSDQYYFRPASYYYYQYAYERAIYALQGQDIDRSKAINVEEIAGHLDTFFIAEKLRYYCYALARKPIIDRDYEFLFMDELIRQVEENGFDKVTPINFYYQVYLTQQFPDEDAHYHRLKGLIADQIETLPNIEAKEIMDMAFNYCILKINAGVEGYTREIFDLYKQFLENELLLVNGVLDPWNFRNVIVSGLRLGEYQWVESFIENFQDKLDERYRANAVSFHLANLYFYQKDYDKVLELLREVEYEDPSYNRNSKTMLIATYYELDEIDPLMSLLTSFSVYLRRSKSLTAARKEHYHNLIKYMRSLIRTPVHDKKALKELRRKVESTERVVNKSWLLSRIDELI